MRRASLLYSQIVAVQWRLLIPIVYAIQVGGESDEIPGLGSNMVPSTFYWERLPLTTREYYV